MRKCKCRANIYTQDTKCRPCRSVSNHNYAMNNRDKRTEYFRQYRKTKYGKEATARAVKKYESNNSHRKRAWAIANYYHKEPKPCIKCGRTDSVRHHPDIKKEKEIVFLCHLHHRQEHAAMVLNKV